MITKHEWWATPVWEIQTEFDKYFNYKLENEIGTIRPDGDGTTFNIWDYQKPCIVELKEAITKIIFDITSDYIPNNSNYNIGFSRGWVNRQKTGEGMMLHDHGNTIVAVTYYIQAPENCGDLLLIDPRSSHTWDRQIENNIEGVRHKRIKPLEGKLVIFPAYLLHMVEPNKSTNVRISLSTNIMINHPQQ